MEISTIEIKPLVGMNELTFGSEPAEVENYLGEPAEIEDWPGDEDGSDAEAWNYLEEEITVFFEKDYQGKCTGFETDNRDSVMFGEKIFGLNENELKALMEKNGFKEVDADMDEHGERRLSFNDAVMDFYFENDSLISVSWGVLIDFDTDVVNWPA